MTKYIFYRVTKSLRFKGYLKNIFFVPGGLGETMESNKAKKISFKNRDNAVGFAECLRMATGFTFHFRPVCKNENKIGF